MLDLNKEHISLILPINPDTGTPRKSLRRYWNQLSRFQRNIILTILVVALLTTLILLSNENSTTSSSNNVLRKEINHIKISPYKEIKEHPDNILHKPQTPKIPIEVILGVAETPNNENNEIIQNKSPDEQQEAEVIDEPKIYKGDHSVGGKLSGDLETKSTLLVEQPKDFTGPTNEKQKAVVEAFKHAWKGYKEYAWGHDNLKPISMGYSDWFGLGLTIVDALDTMYIMDLQDEFDEAKVWISEYLNFNINRDVNLFEVTIRVVGGLLSGYHLTGDKMFLDKATDIATRLLPCFDSPSGIPFSDVNIGSLQAHAPKWSPDSSTSEVTTIQLEFKDLARSTGNENFNNVVETINQKIHNLEKNEGLVPIFINAVSGTFRGFSTVSLGARGDSYYEYLLKQWIQAGKPEKHYLIEDYKTAISGVIHQLVRKTPNEQHVYIGELINGKDFKPKMDHLTCYLPGTLLLGYKNGMPESHFTLAKDLMETCYQTYMKQPTLLAPEITYFNLQSESETDIYVKPNDAHNLLRPEFIESLYYFYALSGNKTYQDMGWIIFQAFEKYTKVKNGYTSIGNVKNILNTRPRDMMESFFLGETLKYFYLLFSDDRNEIDLTKYVFNTEAHILPIWKT